MKKVVARLDDGARHAGAAREAHVEQQVLEGGLEDGELDGGRPVGAGRHVGPPADEAHGHHDERSRDEEARPGKRDDGRDVT